jgi:N-acetylglutamate synthase-like GNAT family acetyltransferase
MAATLRSATEDDWPAIEGLLRANHLPVAGFLESVGAAVVATDGAAIVGAAGVELYAEGALLRSVVVSEAARGQRLGHRLTQAALDAAAARGVGEVFLLTTTAEEFFPKLGFTRIDRASVPASVQQSVEFRGACPASAVAMRRRLQGGLPAPRTA